MNNKENKDKSNENDDNVTTNPGQTTGVEFIKPWTVPK